MSNTHIPSIASDMTDTNACRESKSKKNINAAGNHCTMADLSAGTQARITHFTKGQTTLRRQLLTMGLTPNTPFTVVRHAPLGDPIEIQVRGYLLSLRKKEAALIQVETT